MDTVVTPHIFLDEAGIAWLEGTRTKVIEVVLCQQANGLSVEGVHEHLEHLSVEQIEAALAFYAAHEEELDQEIERQLEWVHEFQKSQPRGPTREQLLARLKNDH